MFLPQRKIGTYLSRILGLVSSSTRAARRQFAYDQAVTPNHPMDIAWPGLIGLPARELWAVGGDVIAPGPTTFPYLRIAAQLDTFASDDDRTPAGVWVLDWQATYDNNALATPYSVWMGVDNDTFAVAGTSGTINPLGGSGLRPTTYNAAAGRTPRCIIEVGADSARFSPGRPPFVLWAGANGGNRNTYWGLSTPIYVPPGHSFYLALPTAADCMLNAVIVEAEERPIPPFVT